MMYTNLHLWLVTIAELGQTCFIAILSYGHASSNYAVSAIFFMQAMVILIAERCNIKIQAASTIMKIQKH